LKITAASNQNNKKLQIYGTYYRTDVINIFARACMFALENGFAEWEREKLDFEPFVYEVDEEVEDAE
ncbi:MAG TPA: hypothetical protein VK158_00680, partial [Acidobacteriota bacterium]|nr:hypothetical protein [Acidobacteriota bacterium]